MTNKIIKEIIKEPYYKRTFEYYKGKEAKELIKILEMTLNNNLNVLETDKRIANYENLKPYDKDNLNKCIDWSKSIFILNYLIQGGGLNCQKLRT